MDAKANSIDAAKKFEFVVNYVWPFLRWFFLKKLTKRCVQCAASSKMVQLDHDQICSLCRGHDSQNVKKISNQIDSQQTDQLNHLLRDYQQKGPLKYDALVLFSGGKDSTYFIKRIQNEFPKLRMLALTVDNGFMSPIAKENIETLIEKLNIDHLFYRPKSDFHKTLFRYGLTHLNEGGGYGTVDFSDGEFMLDTARKTAAENKIPIILCGYSKYQVQNGLNIFNFESPRELELTTRQKVAGMNLTDIFQDSNDLSKWWNPSTFKSDDIARLIFPLYAWDLEEEEIKSKVNQWGLLPNSHLSPIVTNHQLIPVLGVVDVHRFGFSSFEYEFCRMIREGKADRQTWHYTFEFLEYVSITGLFVKQSTEQSLKILGLTTEDVGVKFR